MACSNHGTQSLAAHCCPVHLSIAHATCERALRKAKASIRLHSSQFLLLLLDNAGKDECSLTARLVSFSGVSRSYALTELAVRRERSMLAFCLQCPLPCILPINKLLLLLSHARLLSRYSQRFLPLLLHSLNGNHYCLSFDAS